MEKNSVLCPVPQNQRPINEYKKIKDSISFFWSSVSLEEYIKNLLKLFFFIFCFSLILVIVSSNPSTNLYNETLYSLLNTSFVLILLCSRTYLGWKYIYDRLIKGTVAYEESGWYDGQIWVKTPETLMQDKLAGMYKVLPLLNRLKNTCGIFLFIFILSFFLLK